MIKYVGPLPVRVQPILLVQMNLAHEEMRMIHKSEAHPPPPAIYPHIQLACLTISI